jgi:hypothetical protein
MDFILFQEDELVIYPRLLLFLLEDYVAKLDHCLPSTAKRISSLATSQQAASAASVGYANLDRIATPLIARHAVKLLTFILRKLETTAEYCQVSSLTVLMTVFVSLYERYQHYLDMFACVQTLYSLLQPSLATSFISAYTLSSLCCVLFQPWSLFLCRISDHLI